MVGFLFAALIQTSLPAQAQSDPQQIAARFAPLLLQKAHRGGKYDKPTRVDFDGDFISNNNWANAEKLDHPLAIYYDVFETKTHWILIYHLFYPRDVALICFPQSCHENDLEGLRILVEKDPNQPGEGKVFSVETSAHGRFSFNHFPLMRSLDGSGPKNHVAVIVNGGGHPLRSKIDSHDRWEWEFYPGGRSDIVTSKKGRFSYELRPMSELWDRRDEIGFGRLWTWAKEIKGRRFAIPDVPGPMSGEKHGKSQATSLWQTGEWFFDPALQLWERIGKPPGFSLEYVYHYYQPFASSLEAGVFEVVP